MVKTLIKILIVAVVLNLIYELLHSRLYKTCLEASFKKYWFLMIKACIFDGIAITIIYYFSQLFPDYLKLIIFSVATLAFAYFWELHSIKKGKWEYSRSEEHTSELQSQFHLVCRLLLEKK